MSDEPDIATQLQQLQAERVAMQLDMAKMKVYAKHPHLQGMGLLEGFQGGPDQIAAFGDQLAERIPPPAPTPASLTQQPQPAQPVTPAPQGTPASGTQVPVPVAPTDSLVAPQPPSQDILPQQSADVLRADDIRERMRQGLATRAEVTWLSQHAPRREVDLGNGMIGHSGGFVAAVKGLGRT